MPLSKVLKQITAANLYAPGFRFKDDVDTDTRRWIAETFSPQVARGKRSAAAPTAADSPARPPSPKALAPVAQDLPLLTFNQFSYQEDELAGLARACFDTVTSIPSTIEGTGKSVPLVNNLNGIRWSRTLYRRNR